MGNGNLATTRLRELLDGQGAEWRPSDIPSQLTTKWRGIGNCSVIYDELVDSGGTRLQVFVSHFAPPLTAIDVTPEQALDIVQEAKVRHEDGERLENFKIMKSPVPLLNLWLEPKVPFMTDSDSPEWVDWAASLEHRNPTTIHDAVENIVYLTMDLGRFWGPNGNVIGGVDEGLVATERYIKDLVADITTLVEREECHDVCPDAPHMFACDRCGATRTQLESEPFAYCPSCGAKIVSAS